MRIPRRIVGWHLTLALGLTLLSANVADAALASWKIKQPTTPRRVAPPTTNVPLVVRTPVKPIDVYRPPTDLTVGPAEIATPEPASLFTGLVGGGFAAAVWLKRKRHRSNQVELREDDSVE